LRDREMPPSGRRSRAANHNGFGRNPEFVVRPPGIAPLFRRARRARRWCIMPGCENKPRERRRDSMQPLAVLRPLSKRSTP